MAEPLPPTQRILDDLVAENLRLRQATHAAQTKLPGSLTGIYVGAVVVLSALGVAGVVTILISQPERDNSQIITTLLAFLVPTVLALLAAAVREVHVAFNSRMTELLSLTEKSARAEGQLAAAPTSKS